MLRMQGKLTKCAHRFCAPDHDAMVMVSTAAPILHDARMWCLTPCDGWNPADQEVIFDRTVRSTAMGTRSVPIGDRDSERPQSGRAAADLGGDGEGGDGERRLP